MNKKSILLKIGVLTAVFTLNAGLFVTLNKKPQKLEAYSSSSLPTTIDLNDCGEQEVRSYYSILNSKSVSERQGTNLLKNLKTILSNGQKYYSYDNSDAIWKIYEIADRDWEKSPASSTTYGTYNANTNTITNYQYGSNSNGKNNPYIHALYINRNVDNQTKAWGDHSQTNWGINREHIWAKSHGFQVEGAGGARGDPMHLWAANGHANNIHSNYFYAFVNKSKSYENCGNAYSYINNNLRGYSKNAGGSEKVFEPQDCDKGDIARSIFYMVARYNNYAGANSGIDTNNPNLVLINDLSENGVTGTSTANSAYGMGLLRDLLAWNKLDPVDEYEIHRNNLLCKNFTNNRNPFIDFPGWADAIWGTANLDGTNYNSNITTYASPSSDSINVIEGNTFGISTHSIELEVDDTAEIYGTNADGNISWSVEDGTVISLNKATTSNNEKVTITALKGGTTTITATNGLNSVACTVTVGESINYGSLENPLSVDEAADLISITDTSETEYPLYVKGIVTSNSAFNTKYNSFDSAWLQSNDGSDNQAFKLYAFILDGIDGDYDSANSMVGKEVVAYGYGKVYGGKPQLTLYANHNPYNPVVYEMNDPEPTAIELDKSSASIEVGKTTTITASLIPNNAVATIVWESSDESVATVNNGVVTGVSNGHATITAVVEGTDIEAECLVTVTGEIPVGPKNYLDDNMSVASLHGDAGTSYQQGTDSIDFSLAGLSNAEDITDIPIGSVVLNGDAGTNTGSNNPKYYSSGYAMRVYAGNNITFTADGAITSIVFSVSSGSGSDLDSNTGSFDGETWTGSSNSVTFTHNGSAQVRITDISVTYNKQTISFDSVGMRFSAKIPVSTWNTINDSWEITDYGVMLFRTEPENIGSVKTVEQYYRQDPSKVSIARSNSGNPPELIDGCYNFSIQVNIVTVSKYARYYVAAPFIVADGEYYFLKQMSYSVNTLASYHLTNGGSELSNAALQYLATAH